MDRRVVFITEFLNPPFDEGIKKTAFNLYANLIGLYRIKAFCRASFNDENISIIKTNPLLVSRDFKNQIRAFKPDVILYLPFNSSTFASYLRLSVIEYYAKPANVIFIALQPKILKWWQKLLVRMIRPRYALTPSPTLKSVWDEMNVENNLLPLLTDLNKFKPRSKNISKNELRKKYHLPLNQIIISHVGHLNNGRNLQTLIPLQKAGYQVLVVGSSSTPKDSLGPSSAKDGLLNEGVIVLDGYIENIEEVYQLSDIYIFPVVSKTGSIALPLSILEARACAIPVITTNFGSLNHFLGDDYEGIIYSSPSNFTEEVQKLEKRLFNNFSKTKIDSLNHQFYNIIHKAIEDSF